MNDADRPRRLAAAAHALCTPMALAAIRFYKRHVSPHKGFSCAYRVHVGACSCSTLGLRAISRYGVWRGLGVLRLRLGQCHLAAEQLRHGPRLVAPRGQGGFVDCDIPCDASCVDGCSPGDACSGTDACEIFTCLDCGDDCNWWGTSTTSAKPRPSLQKRRRRRGDPPSDANASPPPPVASD